MRKINQRLAHIFHVLLVHFPSVGADYNLVSQTLVFTPGDTRRCFGFLPIDDSEDESSEFLVVDASFDIPRSDHFFPDPVRNIVIIDDDDVPGEYSQS